MSGRKTKNTTAAPETEAASPRLARAVSLHLEGKREEALEQLNSAIHDGQETAEILAAKGHVQFELEKFAEAAATY